MIRTFTLAMPVVAVVAVPLAAQETAGSVTATIAALERTFVVMGPEAEPGSTFERQDGDVALEIVARPDRSPVDDGPLLRLSFTVTGMGPTADATGAEVTWRTGDGQIYRTGEGVSEVSLTAFAMQENEVALSGNFASQLHGGDTETQGAELAIEGDFQASIRQQGFADIGDGDG